MMRLQPAAVARSLAAGSDRTLTRFAQAVSLLFAPPVTIACIALTVATGPLLPGAGGWWLVWFAVATGLIPLLVTVALWRAGLVADLDLSRREDRTLPVVTGLAATGLASLGALLGQAELVYQLVHVAALLLFVALAACTVRIKVSVHTATVAAWLALCLATATGLAAPIALVVVLTGWSRVWLGRHRLREVALGAALGFAIPWLVFSQAGLG